MFTFIGSYSNFLHANMNSTTQTQTQTRESRHETRESNHTTTNHRSSNKKQSHPLSWDSTNHYGMCGQSCPCCRARVEGPKGLGVCPICCSKT